jgi:hypothetical protein
MQDKMRIAKQTQFRPLMTSHQSHTKRCAPLGVGTFMLGLTVSCTILTHCGARPGSSDAAPPVGKIEQAFAHASTNSGIPVRVLMAIGFLESRLQTQSQSALYANGHSAAIDSTVGYGQSAFGLALPTQHLQAASSANNSSELVTQIEAYGLMLKDRLKPTGTANSTTSAEKMSTILQLAAVHRGDGQQNRKVWSIFAMEVMNVLNQGFATTDLTTGEKITLEKESTPMRVDDMPANYQQDLALYPVAAEIRAARFFDIAAPADSLGTNKPDHIEVIHCPFSFSACLQLQASQYDSTSSLGTHYIVATENDHVLGTLQVARHNEPVTLLNRDGTNDVVTNRIVIMLTGVSGVYQNGIRRVANPLWINDTQLNNLGLVVPQICTRMQRDFGINESICRSPGAGPNSIQFRVSNTANYHWGDVPDFDPMIFWPYFVPGSGVFGNTTLTQESPTTTVSAETAYNIVAQFKPNTKRIALERLVRCAADNHVVWESIETTPVRNLSSYSFQLKWNDAGVNGNGEQYYRIKAMGDNNQFLGWGQTRILLDKFEKSPSGDSYAKECYQ